MVEEAVGTSNPLTYLDNWLRQAAAVVAQLAG